MPARSSGERPRHTVRQALEASTDHEEDVPNAAVLQICQDEHRRTSLTHLRPDRPTGPGKEEGPRLKTRALLREPCPETTANDVPTLHIVEVAGIEPASDSEDPGLLRVQSADDFLSPSDHADKSLTGSVT